MDVPSGQREARRARLALTACIAVASFVVVGAVVALLGARAAGDARAEFERQGRIRAGQLASLAREPLSRGDTARLASLLRDVAGSTDVLEVSVVDASGRISASTNASRVGATAPSLYRHGAGAGAVEIRAARRAEGDAEAVVFVAPIAAATPAADSRPSGSLALRLSSAPLADARARLGFDLAVGCIALASVSALVYALLGPLLRSISAVRRALAALGRGQLDTRLDPDRLGPLSQLGVTINQLATTYQKMAGRMVATSDRLHAAIETIAAATAEMGSGSERQTAAIGEARAQLRSIDGSVTEIAEQVGTLSRSTKDASGAVLQMGGSIDEVAHSMDALHRAVEASSSSSQEMGAAIQQVAESADEVQRMAEETAASMSEMDGAIAQVSEHTRQASELTQEVSASAEDGSHAVVATIEGIGEIRTVTLEAKTVLARLAQRITEIGEIVDVIGAINDEANLLSLNAAIIAAQAGEQGKAFAVVANHVKTLAQRTASSTQAIESLIHAVQAESANATTAMEAGIRSVETGFERSRRAGEVLETIRTSASDASVRVAAIARAAAEQERNSKYVAEAANRTSAMVMQISSAMSGQSHASRQVLETCEGAIHVYRRVHRSMEEQRAAAHFLTERIAEIGETLNAIRDHLAVHVRTTASTTGAVDQILTEARDADARILGLARSLEDLRAEAEALGEALTRVRASGGDPAGAAAPGNAPRPRSD
ncbi:MAG: methyl-accepting chemotaxis protein [Deltaproteobacteria bacterium]|nr:MAG: methyl-accepting chemotaxis protein [Deltaproteobacteria bacterium]